jgi:hypothetical protein
VVGADRLLNDDERHGSNVRSIIDRHCPVDNRDFDRHRASKLGPNSDPILFIENYLGESS